ncbi:hypothetical protein BRL53_05285 [Corynebacterium ulcerans]|uniref:tyrosine-type recombinase/integrase n=2 Tax=Corynebacterium ulcerans TaxID=65058 RepID=UPI000CC51D51|nr:hypothetical protein BRL53_05285 [Corynebacterium ulcerans]
MARALKASDPNEVSETMLITWSGQQSWMPETRHGNHASVRSFFQWWTRNSTKADPSTLLSSVRRPIPPPRPAPDQVIEKALAAAAPRTQLILRLGAELGLRTGEIAALHTKHLQPISQEWVQLTVEGKGGQERILPCPPHLHVAITKQAANGGYVFPGNDHGHLSARWVGKLAAQALPDHWTLHTLRHRFATTAYNAGTTHDLIAVQQALGHKSITTTQRYTRSATQLKDIITNTRLY